MKQSCSRCSNSSPVYVARAFRRAFARIHHARLKAGATKSFELNSHRKMSREKRTQDFCNESF
jgi:hypothetical protein